MHDSRLGQRRIRVSTIGVPVTAAANQVFRGADMECYMNYLARKVSVTLPGVHLLTPLHALCKICLNVCRQYDVSSPRDDQEWMHRCLDSLSQMVCRILFLE